MSQILEFKVWRVFGWLNSAVFWLLPAYLIYMVWDKLPFYLAHPFKLVFLAIIPFAWYAIPFSFGNMVIRIQREGDDLVLSTIGRPPLIPWGPRPTDFRVPALASFTWSRPHLYAVQGDLGWQFTLAVFIRSRQISEWFHEVGLPRPQGF